MSVMNFNDIPFNGGDKILETFVYPDGRRVENLGIVVDVYYHDLGGIAVSYSDDGSYDAEETVRIFDYHSEVDRDGNSVSGVQDNGGRSTIQKIFLSRELYEEELRKKKYLSSRKSFLKRMQNPEEREKYKAYQREYIKNYRREQKRKAKTDEKVKAKVDAAYERSKARLRERRKTDDAFREKENARLRAYRAKKKAERLAQTQN